MAAAERVKLRVLFDYAYSDASGARVSFHAGEECLLLQRSNAEWWFVARPGHRSAVYVPANYVEEVGVIGKPVMRAKGKPPKPPPKPLIAETAVLRALDDFLEHALDDDDDDVEEEEVMPSGDKTDSNDNVLVKVADDVEKELEDRMTADGVNTVEETCEVLPNDEQVHEEPLYENTVDIHALACAQNEKRRSTERPGSGTESHDSQSSFQGQPSPESPVSAQKSSDVFLYNNVTNTQHDDSTSSLEISPYNIDTKWNTTTAPLQKTKRVAPDPPQSAAITPSTDNDKTAATGVDGSTRTVKQVEEKRGMLNRTRIAYNGKKVKKNWCQSYVVVNSTHMYFYKDHKMAAPKPNSPTGKPDTSEELAGAVVEFGAKGTSSRKNVIQVSTPSGSQYLLQHDNTVVIQEWHTTLCDAVTNLAVEQEVPVVEVTPPSPAKSDDMKLNKKSKKTGVVSPSSPATGPDVSVSEDNRRQRWDWLANWFKRRPGLESLREKGIIKDGIFGSHLLQLCALESRMVPLFVERCITAIEQRGLGIDGIYRVSGNLAQIQKLRFRVDKDDHYDLNDGEFDSHDLTGALKLFFRELQEPLFPFNFFDKFVQAVRNPLWNIKLNTVQSLISLLPDPNRETMKYLFTHLRRVVAAGHENRMHIQNLAIVFGPTLLWPATPSENVTVTMVLQSQVVDFILSEQEHLFS